MGSNWLATVAPHKIFPGILVALQFADARFACFGLGAHQEVKDTSHLQACVDLIFVELAKVRFGFIFQVIIGDISDSFGVHCFGEIGIMVSPPLNYLIYPVTVVAFGFRFHLEFGCCMEMLFVIWWQGHSTADKLRLVFYTFQVYWLVLVFYISYQSSHKKNPSMLRRSSYHVRVPYHFFFINIKYALIHL